jgi:hypothetical protein
MSNSRASSACGDTWVVASVTFVVTPSTGRRPCQVGDLVKSAVWSTDGVLATTRIHIEDGPGDMTRATTWTTTRVTTP